MSKFLFLAAVLATMFQSNISQANTYRLDPLTDGTVYTCEYCDNNANEWGYFMILDYIQGVLKFDTTQIKQPITSAILVLHTYTFPDQGTMTVYGYGSDLGSINKSDGNAGKKIASWVNTKSPSYEVPITFDVTEFVTTVDAPYTAFNFRMPNGGGIFGGLEYNAWGYYSHMLITTAVPEPSTYAMLGLGLGLLGVAARRRKYN